MPTVLSSAKPYPGIRDTVASLGSQPRSLSVSGSDTVFISTLSGIDVFDGGKISSQKIDFDSSAVTSTANGLVAIGGQVRSSTVTCGVSLTVRLLGFENPAFQLGRWSIIRVSPIRRTQCTSDGFSVLAGRILTRRRRCTYIPLSLRNQLTSPLDRGKGGSL